MSTPREDRRWPRSVFGVGEEPDPRFSLANERTFLAWIRTGLAFVAGGVGLSALSQLGAGEPLPALIASVLLIVSGLGCAAGAWLGWSGAERALRLRAPLPRTPLLPLLGGALVLFAIAALVLAL
jgi:putative membrane protein